MGRKKERKEGMMKEGNKKVRKGGMLSIYE